MFKKKIDYYSEETKLKYWKEEYNWVDWEEFKQYWTWCERCKSYTKGSCICYAR